ncbi:MAG TPA: hypothetical protein VFJ97_08850 [Dermatophilaceae bacterium]|nr:hypothetical protein [Dermatophilaceae bacterium]
MTRLLRLFAVFTFLAAASLGLGSPTNAGAASGSQLLRWDIVQISPTPTTILAGGQASARDTARHLTLAVTGSGQADLGVGTAAGGGTFVLRHDGRVVSRGFYTITGFISFAPLAGSFAGVPIRDGIGDKRDTRSGVLTMRFAAYANSRQVAAGTLAVHCALPGSPSSAFEGVVIRDNHGDQFTKVVDDGPTLFHLLARL